MLFIGKAQEMARTPTTERRHNPQTGASYPNLYMTKRMVNHYYFYCVDEDFGPFFLKLCSYFPYNGRLCINGHEYVKRQLDKRGIRYEALDNGIAWCEDPEALQVICDSLDAEKIEDSSASGSNGFHTPSRARIGRDRLLARRRPSPPAPMILERWNSWWTTRPTRHRSSHHCREYCPWSCIRSSIRLRPVRP